MWNVISQKLEYSLAATSTTKYVCLIHKQRFLVPCHNPYLVHNNVVWWWYEDGWLCLYSIPINTQFMSKIMKII